MDVYVTVFAFRIRPVRVYFSCRRFNDNCQQFSNEQTRLNYFVRERNWRDFLFMKHYTANAEARLKEGQNHVLPSGGLPQKK